MPGKERETIITINGLVKRYKGLTALNGIDLKIPQGPIGLLGPNGAGKSTLIKCLLGLVQPTEGDSTILGHPSTSLHQKLLGRSKVGYVPENECLILEMDAVTYVRYMGELSGLPSVDAMQRAHEVLHYVGIGDERYRKIETYSTGMKQKVKLAQSLVHDPELIILDEPTNGMDPKGREEMLDLIKDIAYNHSKNVILSSHLLPDVEHICDHVIILNYGNILVQGNLNDLIGAHEEYEVRIKGDEIEFKKILDKLGLKYSMKGGFIHVQSKDEIIDKLYEAIQGKDIQIRHATRYRQSLEDIFVRNVSGGGK